MEEEYLENNKLERRFNVDIEEKVEELKEAIKNFDLKKRFYKFLTRGKGLDFYSYRDYLPEDDSYSIDWKASLRSNKILVRQYTDEKNLKIFFVIDVGKNMVFGSTQKLKCEYVVEMAASLANLIITSGNKVGFILFNEDIKKFVPPQGCLRCFENLTFELTNPKIYDKSTDIDVGLEFACNYINKSTDSVIIFSDFISFGQKNVKNISLLAEKFETFALMVRDPLDGTLPNISAEVVIENPRTGEQLIINPKIVKTAYEKNALEQENFVKKTFLEQRIDFLKITTDEPFVPLLSNFLKGRKKDNIYKI